MPKLHPYRANVQTLRADRHIILYTEQQGRRSQDPAALGAGIFEFGEEYRMSGVYGGGGFTTAGVILVLFILLVIVTRGILY
jgi:hypothetical protein